MSMLIMSVYIMCRTINGLRESLSSGEIADQKLSLDPLLVDKVRLFGQGAKLEYNFTSNFYWHFDSSYSNSHPPLKLNPTPNIRQQDQVNNANSVIIFLINH